MDFKAAVLQYIHDKGINRQAFADGIPLDKTQLSKYLRGENAPGLSTLNKIYAAYPEFLSYMNGPLKVDLVGELKNLIIQQGEEQKKLHRQLEIQSELITRLINTIDSRFLLQC